MSNELIELKGLKDLDLDLDAELKQMKAGVFMPLPRIRIDHSPSGRHQMFLDLGATLENEEQHQPVKQNILQAVVIQHQNIRALFEEGSTLPACASVNKQPTVEEPVSQQCEGCPQNAYGSKCKPKVRLLLLAFNGKKEQLLVFPLSPTSIKRWNHYVQRLARSRAPYTAVVTRFELEDVQRSPYRWAEVTMTAQRLVTQAELQKVKQLRELYGSTLGGVAEVDFQDPGDKADED